MLASSVTRPQMLYNARLLARQWSAMGENEAATYMLKRVNDEHYGNFFVGTFGFRIGLAPCNNTLERYNLTLQGSPNLNMLPGHAKNVTFKQVTETVVPQICVIDARMVERLGFPDRNRKLSFVNRVYEPTIVAIACLMGEEDCFQLSLSGWQLNRAPRLGRKITELDVVKYDEAINPDPTRDLPPYTSMERSLDERNLFCRVYPLDEHALLRHPGLKGIHGLGYPLFCECNDFRLKMACPAMLYIGNKIQRFDLLGTIRNLFLGNSGRARAANRSRHPQFQPTGAIPYNELKKWDSLKI